MRRLALLLILAAAAAPADEPEAFAIAPRTVTLDLPNSKLDAVAAALTKKTGLPFTYPPAAAKETCDGVFTGLPFWDALERVADQTGNRIALHDHGRKLALAPRGRSREVSSVAGPFRVVADRVTARTLLDDNVTVYDVGLTVHWEPRFPVFRIDAEPTVTKAADDRGTALTSGGGRAKVNPGGAAVHAATVRLDGLTREARKVALLRGHFTVTASAKMLAFTFDKPAAKGAKVEGEKVEAVLKRFAKDEDTWEAEVELTYPPAIPVFESFETWTTENRLRLESPDGKAFAPDGRAVHAVGRTVTATYYFKESAGLKTPTAAGWKLVYEAPSPPVEFRVPFELKDIPLP